MPADETQKEGLQMKTLPVPILRQRKRLGRLEEACGFRGTNMSAPKSGGGKHTNRETGPKCHSAHLQMM